MRERAVPLRLAIIGAGPTCLYLLNALCDRVTGCVIDIYEKGERTGSGFPYGSDKATRLMLANIASIEMPPLRETLLGFLQRQGGAVLAEHGVSRHTVHERSFIPRVLIGRHFEEQFNLIVEDLRARGNAVRVRGGSPVDDIVPCDGKVVVCAKDGARVHDIAVLATGHQFPKSRTSETRYYPSPYTGLLDEQVPAVKIGILGSSLSAIYAAFALADQRGSFTRDDDDALRYVLNDSSNALSITMMSRKGLLPEADFYCPIPYEPLELATAEALRALVKGAVPDLLDRIFHLMCSELERADPQWCAAIGLDNLDADSFAPAYFAARKRYAPFRWAQYNLDEVQQNKADRKTVAWRYALLRMHEMVETCVPHFGQTDRERFDAGLAQVFIDNYAAVPSESIRRLLALRAAGVLDLVELGRDYTCDKEQCAVVTQGGQEIGFDLMIDATGQRRLAATDLPFDTLRACIGRTSELQYDHRFCLNHEGLGTSQVIMLALPYLLARKPFAQGLVACDDIARSAAEAIVRSGADTGAADAEDLIAFTGDPAAGPALVSKPERAAL